METTISERTSIETNGNKTESEINNRINRWFNKQEIIEEPEVIQDSNNPNYKYYFIIGSIVIVSGIAIFCYFNDIKPGDAGNAIIDKIKSSRSWFSHDSTNIINNNTGNNQMNIPTNINPDIQVVDNTQPTPSNVNTVLTSPSLENLNEQAESSWSESISSPDSDKTITPASISESNIPSSSSSSLNTEGSSTSSSITTVSNFIKNNWRKRFTNELNDKINFVESSLMNENEANVDLVDYYAFIVNEYNNEVGVYNFIKNRNNSNIEQLNAMKETLYYFREWIAEYQSKIFTTSNVTIEIGNIHDSPRTLTKDIV